MDPKAAKMIEDIVKSKPGISVGEVAVHLYRSLDHDQHGYTWMINEAVADGLIKRGDGEDEEKLYPAGHDQAKQ